MQSKSLREQGQALVIIALAAIGLVAMVGLAIDGSAKFSDRRHAQNAADTAALAASLSLANGNKDTLIGGVPVWKLAAKDIALENGYSGDLVDNTVEVYLCTETDASCGPYDNMENYVQVIITSNVDTYFARVIGIQQTVNKVQAVTLWRRKGPTFGSDLLRSLNPNTCSGSNGNIVFGGNGHTTLTGGGAYINSPGGTGTCGMEYNGCGDLTVDGGALTTVGSGNVNLGSSSSGCSTHVDIPAPTYGFSPGYAFPPEMPDEPDECTSPLGTWNVVSGVTYLQPGKYYDFPPKSTSSQPVTDIIVMNPGVYCVDSVVKLQDKNLDLTGHDVTIYIKPTNGQFDVQGGHIHLEAPTTGDYAGYLIIINSDFAGTPKTCTINGNSTNVYVGTIFAPYCNFIFNGTNETGDPDLNYGVQVVAYTITLSGNSDINFVYNKDLIAQNDPTVGMMR